ncbi:restriction endonuclease subunit S [Algoriphagus marinus]|uniref:restriction endonuclease subunit S n=1 Tax=Algoriphagus marinus TaxID=1925762 RepID=UPI00094BA885|nr:restriction endonuclease subunit S [Algoriphagus marinus]
MKLLEHFKELTMHPKNAEELKGLILQLAVQGKLTKKWREENPDVEPASILLERIRSEKEVLIQNNKIKKEKLLPDITEDEIPYELPESWVWTRLNNVCEYIQRGKSPKYTEEPKIPVISQKCIQWAGFDISRANFITEESLEKYGEERFLQVGDLLWNSTGDGTIGRVISYPGSDFSKVVADSHVTVVRGFKKYIIHDYLWTFTASPLIQNLVAGRVSGSTKQTELGTGTVKLMEFSLPPLEEQKAIVSIVNTLFKEVEELEQQSKARIKLKEDFVTSALNQLANGDTATEWGYLQAHFKTFFTEKSSIKKLRESILQLAVQGKLTRDWRALRQAQGPEMESATTLLERIKAEKAQLIKAGKIKKEKLLPEISDEEITYDLPEGWVWCRFQEIFDIRDGTHDSPKDALGSNTYPLVTSKNFNNGEIDFETARRISLEDYLKVIQRSQVHSGDILFSMIGGNIGNQVEVGIVTEFAIKNVALFKHYRYGLPVPGFLKLFSQFIAMSLQGEAAGGAQPFVSLKFFRNLIIGLPPEAEQKAIVEKVNALMGFCDSLEKEIEQNTQQLEDLMQSCLREVV